MAISMPTRNPLRYLSLAFAVMPQFQRLPKIQHRFGLGSSEIAARVSKTRTTRDGEGTLEAGFEAGL